MDRFSIFENLRQGQIGPTQVRVIVGYCTLTCYYNSMKRETQNGTLLWFE